MKDTPLLRLISGEGLEFDDELRERYPNGAAVEQLRRVVQAHGSFFAARWMTGRRFLEVNGRRWTPGVVEQLLEAWRPEELPETEAHQA